MEKELGIDRLEHRKSKARFLRREAKALLRANGIEKG